MSRIRADRYTNREGTGAPTFSDGVNVVGVTSMSGDLAVTNGTITGPSQLTISGITSSISDTAADVFVYDTRKDSDGGAWRKRTQNTSWYNETLNTSTRGSRKEFPAVAVIVAETTKVTIYDGDDPDLPMWMVFTWSDASVDNLLGYNDRAKSAITAVNGYLITCSDPDGIHIARFIHDDGIRYTHVNHVYTSNSIANRTNTTYRTINTTSLLVASTCNDIAATVLPNAPIDDTTGLPVPTIAVATDGGVSVIKDDGSVVDITSAGGGNYNQSKAITITEENYLWWLGDYFSGSTYLRDSYAVSLDNFPSSDFTWSNSTDNLSDGTFYALTTNGEAGEIKIGPGNTWAWNHQERNALGGPAGLAIHKPNIGSENNSIIAAITSDYNTGWMHGDIKGAFLSDTDTTNVTGSELITNTDFASDLSGWTNGNPSQFTRVTTNVGGDTDGKLMYYAVDNNLRTFTQYVTCVAGERYVLSLRACSDTANAIKIDIDGTDVITIDDNNNAAFLTKQHTFTAGSTSVRIRIESAAANRSYFTDFSVRLAVEDRSVNDKGLQVFGTVTKSAVATGAELVAYSGFSGSNYLEQPYNTDLNFGTGDFSCISWVKHPNTFASNQHSHIISKINPEASGQFTIQYNTDSTLYLRSGATSYTNIGPLSTNTWQQIAFVRRSGVLYGYKDGNFIGSSNFSADISNNESLRVGIRNSGYIGSWTGSLALLRISGSAPSPEQIKKIYEDEKVLFQENAKATLYGSSDAVTALAFDDDTNLLHVGTSSGRSDLQGLRRINNNTTAVTTAITAQNEFIIEQ